jgi:hypothetical protein
MKIFISKYLLTGCLLSLGFIVNGQESVKSYQGQINNTVNWIKSGQYLQASQQLMSLAKVVQTSEEKARVKYLFGVALMEQGLNQVAAIQFVEVIRLGDLTWTKYAIEKLLIVTDRLGDETLLNYALQRIDVEQMPTQNKEMLYYRLAEIKHSSSLFSEAIAYYSKVGTKSRYYYNALYNMGLAQAEAGMTDAALLSFQKLLSSRQPAKVTDTNKVSAQLAIARTLYQKKEWAKAIAAYSKIPKDHHLWHDSLFEKTWAMLRAGRYRSTLSNFQTLHSTYYEDAYLPESLLLRAIVYLYICQYDEMEKVLSLYEKQYNPSLKAIELALKNNNNIFYFSEIDKTILLKRQIGSGPSLPIKIMKHIAEEGSVRRSHAYYIKVLQERRRFDSDPALSGSALSFYSKRILDNRLNNIRDSLGELVKFHLENVKEELTDLNEQAGFIRYEMINGKKESLKKALTRANRSESSSSDIEKQFSFYVENQYESYPFQGEYWLDEIGNYHYLGNRSCE